VNEHLLRPFGLDYLQTVAFILVVAAFTQFLEMILERVSPRCTRRSASSSR